MTSLCTDNRISIRYQHSKWLQPPLGECSSKWAIVWLSNGHSGEERICELCGHRTVRSSEMRFEMRPSTSVMNLILEFLNGSNPRHPHSFELCRIPTNVPPDLAKDRTMVNYWKYEPNQ
ncbi:hypothetical protein CEXT_196291 [Caerostris extrusa]|uniref:Uncharacterized protein n=1 Tax=Caerostris extrusa TaxID=172846 RepID=A0AAV4VJZ0_CAEEX|nr:hypothetical protein CEXT_196291 [Caerostris extrusa]